MVNKVTRKKHYRPPGQKKEGNAARYVTRSQAVKQLQIGLPLFRKLCIYKGIFPREPKKKVKGNHHTYYHLKDIAFLHHEPLLEKCREIRAYEKKIKKADAKKNKERANFLIERKPTYLSGLLRIIKERYPKFIDVLRDLDDCLSLVHLFAALPAQERLKVEAKRIHECRRLSHEWQAFISRTHKLRKVFISVKGIYYQAEVEGQKITWLAPHSLHQILTDDVDLTVILNFMDFYEKLLAHVNKHLFNSINLEYPPILDPRLEALAAEFYALLRFFDANTKTSLVNPNSPFGKVDAEDSELRLAQLQHQLPLNEPTALMHLVEDAAGMDEDEDEDTRECKKLFKNMKFFLSREVHRESLLFIIPAFGGMVSWEGDGAPFRESEKTITHQIVDRSTQTHKFLSRDYVQPQWVFDCVNNRMILPTEDYLVGRDPPPHLSPFVDNDAEGYVPDYAVTLNKLKADAKNEVLPLPGVGKEDLDDPQKLLDAGVIDRAKAIEAAEMKQKMMALEKEYHDELKLELQGGKYPSAISKLDKQLPDQENEGGEDTNLPDYQQMAEDTDNLSKVMMSRKKKNLYEAMQIGKRTKKGKIDLLHERKKKHKESHKSQ
ncbi:pescadillo homolog [Cucumis melo]|uniref:Pescadillo homolog n=1 Tax=Cucumis melo TaxID=3656 RepID=A0A1S3CHN2_CUCME|nr:pescadillo homolog [Cucumis melo]